LCRGVDLRQVNASRERKSISVEETYAIDLPDLDACQRELPALIDRLMERVRRARAERQLHKVFVKIRFADFRRTTVECVSTQIEPALYGKLLENGFRRGNKPVRLLGAGVRLAGDEEAGQLGLFGIDTTVSQEYPGHEDGALRDM
ncbi:MAG: dinB, partial [Noviherbaspirillum sp.]|nr:dinB [Noviherbaspirillum sp.]